MKFSAKSLFRKLPTHYGLRVKYVTFLNKDVHGKLLPQEKCILLNAHEPRYERLFTLLHEIGHFVIHFQNPRKTHHPRFFDGHSQFAFWAKLSSFARRYYRFVFNKPSTKERQADLWAMIWLFQSMRYFAVEEYVWRFLDQHPEKRRLFWYAIAGSILGGIKKRFTTAFNTVLEPFLAL